MRRKGGEEEGEREGVVRNKEDEIEREEIETKNEKADDGVKEIEGVIFVPFTPGSKLRESLQRQDEMLAEALNVPSMRFIEKAGTIVIQDVGQSDPWAVDQFCPRTNCWHCQGRHQLLRRRGRYRR